MDKKCIVTGGNGFIGPHMCRLLDRQGWEVHIIDNYSGSPPFPTHHFGSFHQLDIADPKVLQLFQDVKPIALFHFAAIASIGQGEKDPTTCFKENVIKSVELINYCIQAGIPNFIFSSSCATYGIPQTEKVDEKQPQKPINTYGQTKLIVEQVLRDLSRQKLINTVVLRYFNAAGCAPDGVIGERNQHNDRLIPNLCHAALQGHPLSIYGDQFETPDGSCIRDYVHVEDLTRAHLDGYSYLQKHQGFSDFNLGSCQGYSVKEVINTFQKILNKALPVNICPPRIGDPPKLVADSSKAEKILNFKVKYNLEDCIKHALNFYQNFT